MLKKLYRVGEAANYLGVHPNTLRRYVDEGKIDCVRVGKNRKFSLDNLNEFLYGSTPKVEAHYVRVSGSTGQETSLINQEKALKETASNPVYKIYKDKASGLNENRRGLDKLLTDAKLGKFNVVRVTHEDRLTRFGYGYLVRLLESYGVRVEVLEQPAAKTNTEELLEDFISLVASFSGRMYGLRSHVNKTKLLTAAAPQSTPEGGS